MFYPASGAVLKTVVEGWLEEPPAGPTPKALIVPHAGLMYSGPVAGKAYSRIIPAHKAITRVVIIGPCHRVALRGLALSGATAFQTPLGAVPVDRPLVTRLQTLPHVGVAEAAHEDEHSIEVQLPFLQVVLASFSIVPVAAGEARPEEVAALLETAWGGPETLIVVSTDLSHYHPYEQARAIDEETAEAIERMDVDAIEPECACGCVGLRGLLLEARRRGMRVERIDLRNSGDTAGPKDQVVGYGAFALME